MLITFLVNQSTTIEGMTFLPIETPENIVDEIFEIHAHWRGEKTQQDNMLRPVCLLEENNKDIIRNWFGETEKYGPSAALLCNPNIFGHRPIETEFHEAFIAVERIWSTWKGKARSEIRRPNNLVELAKYVGEPFTSRIDEETAKRMLETRNQRTAHSDPNPGRDIPGREWLKNTELLRYMGKAFLMKETGVPIREIKQHSENAMFFSK